MTRENEPTDEEEVTFKQNSKADWEAIKQFWEEPEGKEDPQIKLAPEYFQTYLAKRPSQLATSALSQAFTMWGNHVARASDQVREAVARISYEEDVWGEVEHGVFRAFQNDDRTEEGVALLEELAHKVVPLRSRSALLFTLARHWMLEGQLAKSRAGFQQIVEWNSPFALCNFIKR